VNVRVRLFAAIRDAAGREEVELDLPEPATVEHLRRCLSERVPGAAELIGRAMFAVENQYATDTTPLPTGATVACIPPVSGG